MNARSMVALGVGGLAAAFALALGAWKQLGVKSYGHPAGRVVRAGAHLCVLMETRDPYMPSLKGRSESDMSYSYALWMVPQAGDGGVCTVRLARGVASGSRTHNIGVQHFENGVVWLAIDDLQGVDVASGRPINQPAPVSLVNAPISQLTGSAELQPLEQFRAQAVTLASGERLTFASDDEVKMGLKAGARLYDNPTAKGTYKARSLYCVSVQPGPIPCVGAAKRLSDREFRNGAFMRSAKGGEVVRFTNPDGYLVVHDAGDPVRPTIHFSRVGIDGAVAWTADTGIGRLIQVLPHDTLPALIGEPPQQLTEPMLAVLHVTEGKVKTVSLKGPLN